MNSSSTNTSSSTSSTNQPTTTSEANCEPKIATRQTSTILLLLRATIGALIGLMKKILLYVKHTSKQLSSLYMVQRLRGRNFGVKCLIHLIIDVSLVIIQEQRIVSIPEWKRKSVPVWINIMLFTSFDTMYMFVWFVDGLQVMGSWFAEEFIFVQFWYDNIKLFTTFICMSCGHLKIIPECMGCHTMSKSFQWKTQPSFQGRSFLGKWICLAYFIEMIIIIHHNITK